MLLLLMIEIYLLNRFLNVPCCFLNVFSNAFPDFLPLSKL